MRLLRRRPDRCDGRRRGPVMHWTQALYLGLLCAALAASWHSKWSALIALVMLCNLAATMELASTPLAVWVADAASAAALIGGNRRAQIVATLFSVMICVYVSAWAFGWENSTTYTIIDMIAYAQLGVVGGLDLGIRRCGRAVARRWPVPADHETTRGHASVGVARVSAQSGVSQ